MRKSILYLNILAFILLFSTAVKVEAVEVTASEQTYYRGTATPVTEAGTFHKINGLAKIRVTNGGLEDADNEMVSSSEISLNGEVIISSSNFNQNVGVIEVEENISRHSMPPLRLKEGLQTSPIRSYHHTGQATDNQNQYCWRH